MNKDKLKRLATLQRRISDCEACPRLRRHCLSIAREKRKSFSDQIYWGKPITGFGDADARIMIIGLAPAAHGANRTGRIFTGDRSGDWLFRALHRAGLANQPHSVSRDDGLELHSVYVTCTARCAPPENRPTPAELRRCEPFLQEELTLLSPGIQVWIALGQIAYHTLWPLLPDKPPGARPAFAHGKSIALGDRRLLLSYHPSQQNTFTGRLTEPMFDRIFSEARERITSPGKRAK